MIAHRWGRPVLLGPVLLTLLLGGAAAASIFDQRPVRAAPLAIPTPQAGGMTIYAISNSTPTSLTIVHSFSDSLAFNYTFTTTIPAGQTVQYHVRDIPGIPSPFRGTVTLSANGPFTAQVVGYDYPSKTPTATASGLTATRTATPGGPSTVTRTATPTATGSRTPAATLTRTTAATPTRTAIRTCHGHADESRPGGETKHGTAPAGERQSIGSAPWPRGRGSDRCHLQIEGAEVRVAANSRPFAGEEDYPRMRALLTQTYALGGPVYCTVGDLDWWRGLDDDPDAIRRARLWVDAAGAVVGIAWPGGDQVDLMVHPGRRDLDDEMLAWAESERQVLAGGSPEPARSAPLTTWSLESDAPRNTVLGRRGYARSATYHADRARPLDGPLTPPALPPGYSLRSVRGEADLEARVAVHRDAFAPSRMTVAKHRRVMSLPTYRPDLDLVVVAPDGSFAAFTIVWLDSANRMGVFEPLGCHSAHRRRGLGTAILREGMRRLWDLGARTAHVLSVGESGPAALLYDSVGLTMRDRCYQWRGQPHGAAPYRTPP